MREAPVTEAITIRVHRFRRWMPQLVAAVAEIGGIEPATLIGPGRVGWPQTLRAAIVLAAVDVFEKSWSDIGRDLGGRHHGGVQHAYECARKRLETDGEFRQLVPLVLAIARAIMNAETTAADVEPELAL